MKATAHVSNQYGHICISLRGPETNLLITDLNKQLENAVVEGESGIAVEVEVEDGKITFLSVIGPSSP